jgi:hypothetical protein
VTVEKNQPREIFQIGIAGLERSTTYHYRLLRPGLAADRRYWLRRGQAVHHGERRLRRHHHRLRLSADLNCVRSLGDGHDGLIVGADGIAIDLAGHGVEGVNFALGNDGGFDDVAISGGDLYAVDVSLRRNGASLNRIRAVRAGRLSPPFVEPSTGAGISSQGGEENVVRASRMEENGDFGIDAVEGVTDRGGNTASGNGNPVQCRNVFCG